jgi:L-ascorbate metabolism protein UlaG (beta-lactamase superfamily)
MRFTKYAQSCAIIEGDGGGRVLIDPGNVAMDGVTFDDLGTVDAVLFTHRHADHLDDRAVTAAIDRGLAIYGNADIADVVGDAVTLVTAGQQFQAAGFDIVPHDMPHVVMIDGSAGPPNTGFMFDGRLLHPGDSMQVDGMRVDVLAVPIAGPSISLHDAHVAVETAAAATAIPIHYDVFIADPHRFANWCDIADVVVLDHGETAEL